MLFTSLQDRSRDSDSRRDRDDIENRDIEGVGEGSDGRNGIYHDRMKLIT